MTVVMSGADRVVLLAAGQNVLHPHSHAEHEISLLWWVMFVGSCIGLALIGFLLLLGWLRRNQPMLPFGIGERGATGLVIGLGIALPIALLSALFFWSDVFVIRSTAAPSPSSTAMTVRVAGHQWWWEIRYPGTPAVTANEMHIPVNTRVQILGTTAVGQVGPDLTHVASRMTLAAGTITNDRAHLEQWIADPQHVKPGHKMPQLHVSQEELTALTDYLEGLK